MAMYLKKSHPVIRPSLEFLGGFFMMSRSGGLNPRAVAGKPSVTKLTHNSWTGIRASGIPRAAVRKILHRIKRKVFTHPYFMPNLNGNFLLHQIHVDYQHMMKF